TADANIPGGGLGGEQGGINSASGRTESTNNYEISKTIRTEVQEPGRIQRLSVAVAVDGVRPIGADGQPGEYAPRSEDELARIEQLVRTAVGFNEARGDQVTVVNVAFDPVNTGQGAEAGNPLTNFDKNDIMRAVELAVLALVALLIIFFVVRPLLKNVGGGGGANVPAVQVTRVVTTPDGQTVQAVIDPETGAPLALPGPGELDQRIDIARIEGQVKASSVKRVSDFVEAHPDQSVAILRSWLHETA
ncbi:MAG TPA: flagellar M-ring protein FliF C-terminal domain-containing protein, partial [Phenylobacterium sp.]|nr:flagellar M-ring protein FliF C-terminal domain-containing protein [Phenylobacterium sp.]